MNGKECFDNVMEYRPADHVPNWEIGVWPEVPSCWLEQGLAQDATNWDWLLGDEYFGLDRREYIGFDSGMLPQCEVEVVQDDGETQIIRDEMGRLRKRLKHCTSMDHMIDFPVKNQDDWKEIKPRFEMMPQRYLVDYSVQAETWKNRTWPLIFGTKYAPPGFYWHARDLMGFENLSMAWYDQPSLLHDIFETRLQLLIEGLRPVLAVTDVDYMIISEDMAMKTGPLLTPSQFREFILPRLIKLVEYCKANGVRYVAVDSDGNMDALIPLLLQAGIDALWPIERAAGMDPVKVRQEYGKDLRIWGGVDKREIARGPAAIDAHLRELCNLVEEGGFIPTVDHLVPPDISYENFAYYLKKKSDMLAGKGV